MLNEQLEALYDAKFPQLVEHLEAAGTRVKGPFLLGTHRWNEKKDCFEEDESWYTEADLKVMIIGKETNHWNLLFSDDGKLKFIDGKPLVAGDFMESYQRFYGDNYQEYGTVGEFNVSKSPFFNKGVNGIMSQLRDEILDIEYPGKRAACIWNNISKLSTADGKAVNATTHEIEHEYFHVIPEEVNILKPDIVLFFTGFHEEYERYIHENFNL